MSDVGDFLESSMLGDEFEIGWHVVSSELLETEIPELGVVDVEFVVLKRVLVASVVANPDIITEVSEVHSDGVGFVVNEPIIGTVIETVLQEDRRESSLHSCLTLGLYPK